MYIGDYEIVVEGDPSRKYLADDTHGTPPEGQEIVIGESLYIVTAVRRYQDLDRSQTLDLDHAQQQGEKIHTYPRVFLRRLGDAPPSPPSGDDGDSDGDAPPSGSGRVLQFRVLSSADYQPTAVEELAEERALIAHELQEALSAKDAPHQIVRRVDEDELQHHEGTDVDDLAELRALATHEAQQVLEPPRRDAKEPAAKEEGPRTVLPSRG